MKALTIVSKVIFIIFFSFVQCGVLMMATTDITIGLYNSEDNVIVANYDNVKNLIEHNNYAVCFEFYNSFCGHCRRFAPIYKRLADELYPWRTVLKIMAMDCANDKNNDICREHEVMAYPTIRYMSPNRENASEIGIDIHTQKIEEIKVFLMNRLKMEENVSEDWPNLNNLTKEYTNNFSEIFDNAKLGVLIFEKIDSLEGLKLILDYSKHKDLSIRYTSSKDVASSFHIQQYSDIAIIKRNNTIEIKESANTNGATLRTTIDNLIKQYQMQIFENHQTHEHRNGSINEINKDILLELEKYPKHTIFRADLEQAIRFLLFHEITKYIEIGSEKLLALQHFINTLVRYNPLQRNGEKFLRGVQNYISNNNQKINGVDIQNQLISLEQKHSAFTSTKYIGCASSIVGLRGFTCGLWQLFHFMVVKAVDAKDTHDPLEVLKAIYGYVKYFFGCSDCSAHFQEMAIKNKIWNTDSKENSVLWLWRAHNEVNKRLAGDPTEDPRFPKIQFPSKESCKDCSHESTLQGETEWNSTVVLEFLKTIYDVSNLNEYGTEINSTPEALPLSQQVKHKIDNDFPDIDLRIGLLLYGFCIVMMLIVVKLLVAKKGYRRKTHTQEFYEKI